MRKVPSDPFYKHGVQFISGNEAIAEGAIYAGCRFFAGYPITPSSEIAEHLSRRLPAIDGVFLQMEDEIASIAAILGASIAGVKSMTATSGPGFSLMQENIGYGYMAEIPCVVVDAMRGGPSTGTPTGPSQSDVMQAKWGTHGDHPVIAIAPCSVQECFTETVRAFNLSERFRLPVIVLSDEVIAHMREKVVLPKHGEVEVVSRPRPRPPAARNDYKPYEFEYEWEVPPMASFGEGYRFHITGLVHDYAGFPSNLPKVIWRQLKHLHNKVARNADKIGHWEEFMLDDAEIVVVAYGSSARAAKEAVIRERARGVRVGLFRPITIWPFPETVLAALVDRIIAIIVPELNMGQVKLTVERVVRREIPVVSVIHGGEALSPRLIIEAIRGWA